VIIGGPCWYVRNAMHVALGAAIVGPALLLSSPILLLYAAALLAALFAFVRLYEERTMLARYGESYEVCRKRVPNWWPRLPHRTP
jgi:protein-S-isoprenylcysteine O-methyltransferase Ste14